MLASTALFSIEVCTLQPELYRFHCRWPVIACSLRCAGGAFALLNHVRSANKFRSTDGEWHPCYIDDKLYLKAPSFDESGETVLEQYGVRQNEQEKLYVETLQKGSKALYFASCRDENETWVPLIEKAYAKAHGDFSAMDGGQVG